MKVSRGSVKRKGRCVIKCYAVWHILVYTTVRRPEEPCAKDMKERDWVSGQGAPGR